jgi:hypothetical protein
LASRASTTVTFELTVDDLAAFDESSGRWVFYDGPYELFIGRSSRNLGTSAVFNVRGGTLKDGS